MRLLDHSVHVRRIFSGLIALMLAFTYWGGTRAPSAAAKEEPPYQNHEVGLVNASFGRSEACLMDGWTASGNGSVTVAPAYNRFDCMAVLTASNRGGAGHTGAVARLEQSFVVHTRNSVLRFFVNLGSDKPTRSFTPQTIRLYDEYNRIVAEKSLNNEGYHLFEQSLAGYESHSLRLVLSVAANPINAGGPSNIWMTVDFRMRFYDSLFNSTFYYNSQCSLEGWVVSGDITLDTNLENGNCFAVLSAQHRGRSHGGRVSASLDQVFVVSPHFPLLRLYLQPYSDLPGTDFPAQTVRLTDSAGTVIYEQSHNLQTPEKEYNYLIEIDLQDYVGQSMHVHVDVTIDGSQGNSPRSVTLKIDDQGIYDFNGPTVPPGGVW